ncbi:MAG: dTDP-4-dehydrorhamnose reductase [Faecalibacterium sp.]|nr:dTDP-4-dehydrorhamnose reductase [Ruminococcus sp.]MCM1393195.1 dTDP-4-dehydrorhamnose reductase [Ruminococcus sp.]MCM1486649.1 dTDP-4-dehydrorhamnose reductase [Faecalibacterium sp.]
MIIVTGANGQLGSDVCKVLQKRNIEFIGMTHDTLDITDARKVENFFETHNVDAVIHCAAYTAVDKAETDEENCMAVNFRGSLNLARCCGKSGIKLIYVSSDYVFNGRGTKPFEVDGEKGPLNVYGKSKLLGEQAVQENCEKYFIVRTSWVFGDKNTNFIHTMLKLSEKYDSVKVVCDQIGSPTYSKHLAKLLCDMVITEKYGVYHATNEGFCSWSELCEKAYELKGKTTKVIPVTTSEYGSKTDRPLNSRLSKKSLDDAGFERLPKWEGAVEEYLV